MDGKLAEMNEAAGNFWFEKLPKLAILMYDTADVPENMMKNLFVAIRKKPDKVECEEHRTIIQMS